MRAVTALSLMLAALGCSTVERGPVNTIRKVDDGLYFMDFEGSNAKSTIVEFADFVAVIEVPVKDEGGGARKLEEHAEGGERVLRSLARQFPDKPLEYVLSSHWHPHSLSSLAPFLAHGVTVVTTKANFDKLGEMLGSSPPAAAPKGVWFVTGDSFEIKDAANRIVAHRFAKKDYTATPTEDYLYFELPKYDAMHCGCMYSKWDGGPVMGRDVVTSREEDLYRFMETRGIRHSRLIRLNRETDALDERLPFSRLESVVRTGLPSREITAKYRPLTIDALRTDRALIAARAVKDNIPPGTFNTLAYECLRKQDLSRALEFAMLQTLVAPASGNAWDTLGEMYYAAGEVDVARAFERASRKVQPEFTGGGEPVWKADLDDLRKAWAEAKP